MTKFNGLRLLKILVIVGAIVYFCVGVYSYFKGTPDDLQRRWREEGYLINGYDPIKVGRSGEPVLAEYGKLNEYDGYPPWSYIYALILVPPIFPFSVVKILYFVETLLLIVFLGFLVKKQGEFFNLRDQWPFIFGAVLSCAAIPVSLLHGQYGILVTIMIWAFLYFEYRGNHFLAGLCLAIAGIKPQVSALFFLIPLVRKSFWTCFWTLAVGGIATVIASIITGTLPWNLVLEIWDTGVKGVYYAGLSETTIKSIDFSVLLKFVLPFFTVITFIILLMWRRLPVYVLGAIPAVFSTVWISNRAHDLFIISLLVAPILWTYLQSPEAFKTLALATGISHWFPHLYQFYVSWPVPFIYRAFWVSSLVIFLFTRYGNPLASLKTPSFTRLLKRT